MKKISLLLLLLCFMLALAACGDNQPTRTVASGGSSGGSGTGTEGNPFFNNQATSDAPTDTPVETPTPVPADTPTPDDTPMPSSNASFPYSFTATDVYGNTVTEQSLGEKQVFFVHLWATWCGPCLAEMPDFAQLVQNYGDKVGFIALLTDFSDNQSGAKNIVENAGIPTSFIMVDAYTAGLEEALSLLNSGYVPTTVILYNDNGNWQSSPQLVGAYGSGYARELDNYLN
jgi:thiol-disulfide isomerase/thioredoxin